MFSSSAHLQLIFGGAAPKGAIEEVPTFGIAKAMP
jgi:hypothetical protein